MHAMFPPHYTQDTTRTPAVAAAAVPAAVDATAVADPTTSLYPINSVVGPPSVLTKGKGIAL